MLLTLPCPLIRHCRHAGALYVFQKNEKFGEELEADLLEEGGKLGPVEKITVFAKNTMGPVVIKVTYVYGANSLYRSESCVWSESMIS